MKNLFFLFVLCIVQSLAPAHLFSQVDFFAPGAEWYYGFKTPGLLQAEGYTHYIISGDTIIEARNAKIIQRTSILFDYGNPTNPVDTAYHNPLYMNQSGDSIFYFDKYDTLWQFLWKMDVQGGDAFEVEDYPFVYYMDIDSTDFQVYNNHDVKKIWLSGGTYTGQGGDAVIYDRFGPTNGFGYYSCWGFYDCYDPTLCRFESDEMGRVDFPGSVCDILMTGTQPVITQAAIVFPNPFEDVFLIDMVSPSNTEMKVELYNLQGQLAYVKTFYPGDKPEVDLSGQAGGVYVGRVVAVEENRVIKVIKVVKE